MRIISKFHDYYDTAMGLGQDRSRVYLRDTQEFEFLGPRSGPKLPAHLEAVRAGLQYGMPGPWTKTIAPLKHLIRVTAGAVLFAGRIYPFARMEDIVPYSNAHRYLDSDGSLGQVTRERCFYSAAELEAALAPFDGMDDQKKYPGWLRRIPGRTDALTVRQSWAQFLDPMDVQRLSALAYEQRLPVALLDAGARKFVLNPKLADVQFFRALSPEQAYQELDMFFGNLAMPERNMVEIEDRYRIPQHGFDSTSFRKGPQPSRAQKRNASSKP